MKKVLGVLGVLAITLTVAALFASAFDGHTKKAPPYYTVRQASTALASYVNAKIATQGAHVSSTRCSAVVQKADGTYALDTTDTSGLYGCIVAIRADANPTVLADCGSLVFKYPPGASGVSNVQGSTLAKMYCQ